MANEIRTSIIKKSIKRTIKTAQYESLVIEHGFEETIEWKNLSERDKKIENWETVLLQEYKRSHDSILEELGFSEKKAYFNNPSSATIQKFQHQAKSSDDLDDLDTLG